MNLAWCMIGLVLGGADDSQTGPPQPASAPVTIEIKISGASLQPQNELEVVKEATAPEPGIGPAAAIFFSNPVTKLPTSAKPATTKDPEAPELWPMNLQHAIRIGLDNCEIVRVIAFGAQGIPVGGFEPTPLNSGAGAGVASALGSGTVTGVHDVPPAGPADGHPDGRKVKSRPIVIARLNADASVWRFEAEVMAHVRSVEQQYWNLAQAQVERSTVERAAHLAQEILDKEQAKLAAGKGTKADVAEAAQRLEQLNLDLVTRTSDVITTERQLRFILGLPPSDNRRIIPVTKPTEELVEFDWETCLSEMMREQPDIVQQEALSRVAELQLMVARFKCLPQLTVNDLHQLEGVGQQCMRDRSIARPLDSALAVMTGAFIEAIKPVLAETEPHAENGSKAAKPTNFAPGGTGVALPMPLQKRQPMANEQQSQNILMRARAYRQQVVQATTHSLARMFLEVDANYKQYKTSKRLVAAAAERLEAERARYEQGQSTVDRYLDAISQFATAVVSEHQYLTTYNSCLAGLSESKGTLLADRNIVVAEGPRPTKSWQAARAKNDDDAKPASLAAAVPCAEDQPIPQRGPSMTPPGATPFVVVGPDPKPSGGARKSGAPGARAEINTWKFAISVGSGKSFEIKAFVSVDGPGVALQQSGE